jgi:hypothetical protein
MSHRLKPGDVVEVRSPAEILSTLDSEASIDGMPFMGEMLQYAGRRFTVTHRVEKICDTASGNPPNSRRMYDTVLLDDLRCDGSAHGGCQAGCRIYWKESWLRRVDQDQRPADGGADARAQLEELATAGGWTSRADNGDGIEIYRCQATEAVRASEQLGAFDLRQYARELASGNVGLQRFLRVSLRATSLLIGRKLRLRGIARRLFGLLGLRRQPAQSAPVAAPVKLDLQPGEVVEVRPREEIARTLDANGKMRGLWYDPPEMGPYSGGRYRVKERVERIIDERTGEMIEIASDCLILDGVICTGDHSACRWFCPRGIYAYWREAWLHRVDESDATTPTTTPGIGNGAAGH